MKSEFNQNSNWRIIKLTQWSKILHCHEILGFILIVTKKIFEAVTYQNNYGEIAKGTLAKLSAQIGRNKEMPKDFTQGPNPF